MHLFAVGKVLQGGQPGISSRSNNNNLFWFQLLTSLKNVELVFLFPSLLLLWSEEANAVSVCPPQVPFLSLLALTTTTFLRRFTNLLVRKRALPELTTTLGQFIGLRDNFYLHLFCRWLCVFTRSETALTTILVNGIMATTNATDIAEKLLGGRRCMWLNSLNFISCSWCHLVLHR